MVEFDFLGKGSIRYSNKISVDEIVYPNLQRFLKNKSDEGYVFDLLRVSFTIVYSYLQVTLRNDFTIILTLQFSEMTMLFAQQSVLRKCFPTF